jgi:hypothetical protein
MGETDKESLLNLLSAAKGKREAVGPQGPAENSLENPNAHEPGMETPNPIMVKPVRGALNSPERKQSLKPLLDLELELAFLMDSKVYNEKTTDAQSSRIEMLLAKINEIRLASRMMPWSTENFPVDSIIENNKKSKITNT